MADRPNPDQTPDREVGGLSRLEPLADRAPLVDALYRMFKAEVAVWEPRPLPDRP